MTDPRVGRGDALARPVWQALAGRQTHLAQGDALARRFDPAYGPFAAAADASAQAMAALAALVPPKGEAWLVEPAAVAPPPGTRLVRTATCLQMVAARIVPGPAPAAIVELTDADAARMRALARLTVPGPFAERTHRLGRFVGVQVAARLVAMAGERMRPGGYTEVSGVCTHPDHRGQGLAAMLMRHVAQRMLDRGETPFLHCYASNAGAIRLYGSLGFVAHGEVVLSILARTSPA